MKAPGLQPPEELAPRVFALAVGDSKSEYLPRSCRVDAGGNECAVIPYAPALAYLDHYGVHDEEWVGFRIEATFVPFMHCRIQTLGEVGNRGLGELGAAELLRDVADLAGGHPINHHLHKRGNECRLAALIPFEQVGRQLAL